VRATLEVAEEQASKIGVHTLITTDELIGECKARHETTFLEPEDRRKGTREEDAFDGSEGDQALTECGTLIRYPLECPVSLALDARNSFHSVKEIFALGGILDVSVDKKRVSFGVNVLHHDLEAVEAPSLGSLDLVGETFN